MIFFVAFVYSRKMSLFIVDGNPDIGILTKINSVLEKDILTFSDEIADQLLKTNSTK